MKKKVFAIALNIIMIGAGHIYINSYKKAFLFCITQLFIVCFFYFLSTIYLNKYIFILNVLSILFVYLYSIYDVLININKLEDKSKYTKGSNIFFYFLFYILINTLFIYLLPIKILFTPSNSMSSTLIKGDRIAVNTMSPSPKRGDIVVFRYPKAPEVHYVKRCVAVGGDEILFQEKHLYISFHEGEKWMKDHYPKEKLYTLAGKTWVLNPYKEKFSGIHYDKDVNSFEKMQMYLATNNFAMQPVIVDELPKNLNAAFNAFYKKVPKNEYYMVGDNRDHSNDSRFWGSVSKTLIFGKPKYVYYSSDNYNFKFNRIGNILNGK